MEYKIGFGGGCHWCTEAVFQSVVGVSKVMQGWIISDGNYSEYSEGVIVYYDDKIISITELIGIHLHTHSCTSIHSLRTKYRSAIYTYDQNQAETAEKVIKKFQAKFDKEIITLVLPMVSFKTNKSEYLDYYYKNPKREFCQRYIDPKLRFLLDSYPSQIDSSKFNF